MDVGQAGVVADLADAGDSLGSLAEKLGATPPQLEQQLLIIGALAVSIIVHEAGHLVCAWSVGLPAKEFSIGFGPSLVSWPAAAAPADKAQAIMEVELESDAGGSVDAWTRETRYVVRSFPFGGYVRFDDKKTETLEDGSKVTKLDSLPPVARLWVLSGGPMANFTTAFLILAATTMSQPGMPRGREVPGIYVEGVPQGSSDMPLRVGDVLVKVGDTKLGKSEEAVEFLQTFFADLTSSDSVNCVVLRDGQPMDMALRLVKDPVTDGIRLGGADFAANVERTWLHADGPAEAALIAGDYVWQILSQQASSLAGLASGAVDFAGPLGAIAEGQQMAQVDGVLGVIIFFVIANMNLGFVNALPVPALDGGKAIFVLLEQVRGKRLDEDLRLNIELTFAVAFFFVLLSLTAKDLQGVVAGLS
eukprot:TRINITY_DN22032_c0_g1_i2.p1 TRINITY_DN22032_c0_g1~~TRINITY_DN22032_c0_g1_i2.p1  ORF type:complete len:419 (-),score=53.75 TRINITY_DN22032_c0_g1_i2:113-1369(-)